MGLFSKSQMDEINSIAQKSKEPLGQVKQTKSVTSFQHEIDQASKAVLEYFRDSEAILITSREQLHEYVLNAIEAGYCGIDTETTGLDRIHDTIVGTCLYYPGGVEAYIPSKHLVPVFDVLYNNQLSYEDVGAELQLFVEAKTKMIFANADFDLAFIYKDLHVDMISICYYDVILAWRCLKEDEQNNGLKPLYCKYVLKGKADAKKFSDFFSPKIFPYCNPEVAKLYAANDAKITYELFMWQLPYVTKSHPKCQKHKLEKIADLIWNIEIPMIRVCALMHRTGVYYDTNTRDELKVKYDTKYKQETNKLSRMIQEVIDNSDSITISKSPFKTGQAFNEGSAVHVKYLLTKFLGCDVSSGDKETLRELNLPITKQILEVRAANKLLNTFIDKLPNEVAKDGRIHSTFKSIGADCIVGDSIIPTTNGYQLIGELCESYGCKEAEHVEVSDLFICNKDQIQEQAQSVIKYTDYPTIKITTEYGYEIEGTYNHPIMISNYTIQDKIHSNDVRLPHFWENRDFKKLEDIRVGDYIEIPCNYDIGPSEYVSTNLELANAYNSSKCIAKLPQLYTEEFAEFLGMYHADGCAGLRSNDSYTITISNDDPDVISRVDELALHLFNISTTHYINPKIENEFSTYINNMQIKDIDKILSHGARNKRIPSGIWKSPKSVINSYIKGLTLDSSVYRSETGRAKLSISIANELDAKLIQQHLASQGIYCQRNWNNHRTGWRSCRLTFTADNYLRFCNVIGFVQSSKYIHTEPCKVHKYESTRIDNSFRVKVKKIEYATNTVYDLTVPETHSFIANGMINHNTGRMSSEKPNVQQIPSHAIDIRHQFRATPMMEKVDVCIETDKELHITLGSYDSVTVTDNGEHFEQKDVIDLCKGDYIISSSGSIQIRDIVNNIPYSTLLFDLFEHNSEVKIQHITPAYVMMSSDYSQQEPKMLAYASGDRAMVDAFIQGKDIYATIASLAFNKPYEECLEFNPITGANQPEGKARRSQAKSIVLGITYGRSTKTIGDQLFGTNKNMSDDDKTKEAQKIYDSVLNAFPNLRTFMIKCQDDARKYGYVETILGRRRHIPDMQLPMYEFKAMPGYVNPDVDPLDPTTLTQKNEIPPRILKAMEKEIYSFKYFGQVVKYIKKLSEQKIKVINNNQWITKASRKCVNSRIQGSAAELTKIAMLKIFNNEEWKQLGARVLLPVHDELIAEVPIRNYKRAEELLSQMMSDAGNFLPFTISCDVTTTLRWYGLEYPCAYTKPGERGILVPSNMSEDEIKWIQYHLFEMEYSLPIIPNEDGSKLEGDAALGVNGKWTKELEEYIYDYIHRYKISPSDFIDHIYKNVNFGLVN